SPLAGASLRQISRRFTDDIVSVFFANGIHTLRQLRNVHLVHLNQGQRLSAMAAGARGGGGAFFCSPEVLQQMVNRIPQEITEEVLNEDVARFVRATPE